MNEATATPTPRAAAHAFVAGHLGELVQGRLGPDGPVVLVTLPCPDLGVAAQVTPGPGRVMGAPFPAASLAAFLKAVGGALPGQVTLAARVRAGLGTGVSTASLLALAQVCGATVTPAALARAAWAIEGAVDPLMFSRPERRLWASRRAETVGHLRPLPEIEVLGGIVGAPQRTDPEDSGFPDVADLVAGLGAARTAKALAETASESARRTRALRGSAGPDPRDLTRATGALGAAIAHTGAAVGLIFAPGCVPADAAARLRQEGASDIIQFRCGG